MAGIDKTYTDNYKEYKAFKEWADKQVVTFFNGHKQCIGNWVWDYEKEDFANGLRIREGLAVQLEKLLI